MAGNSNLHMSRDAKEDEYYTDITLIEDELKHYKEHFRDKIIFCNCDDPYESNFFKYFAMNFNALGLKKLISLGYAGSPIVYQQLSLFDWIDSKTVIEERHPYKLEISEVTDENGDGAIDLADVELLIRNKKNVLTLLKGNGDFRSPESLSVLEEADIVVTNPPFSLMKEYIPLLMEKKKKFLILGNMNHATFKEIFHYFMDDEKKRNAVIDTIMKGFPLNIMYWVRNDDGTFEILDGQQRTISFCQYVTGDFSVKNRTFHNLTVTEQQQILDYQCMIYFCEGNDKEKLDWFKIINIAGEKLTDQELRNAVYTGTWLTSAKGIFSKTQCAAYNLSSKYVTGSPIRQEILQTAISWKNKGNIEEYMSIHQHDPNANELWIYFQNVINWVMLTFPKYRKEMKGIDWGKLYDTYGSNLYDTNELEKRIADLMMDDDVTNRKGIYEFVLSGEERCLNIRAFTESQKRRIYEHQKGICNMCHKHFEYEKMQGDHITPWSKGGKTVDDNLQMLCEDCNRKKLNM